MKIALFLGLALTSLNAFADCPNLSGQFDCPAYGTGQASSPMTVSQTQDDQGVTTYSYLLPNFSSTPSLSKASPNGLIDSGMLKFCADNKLYLGEISGQGAGTVQSHFIDEDGAYVVIRAGKVVQKCDAHKTLDQILEQLNFKKI